MNNRGRVIALAATVAALSAGMGGAASLVSPAGGQPVQATTVYVSRQGKSGQRRAIRRRAERGWR